MKQSEAYSVCNVFWPTCQSNVISSHRYTGTYIHKHTHQMTPLHMAASGSQNVCATQKVESLGSSRRAFRKGAEVPLVSTRDAACVDTAGATWKLSQD